jgi:predicted membrane channel-forming protein YqfA (hemolysin III family)
MQDYFFRNTPGGKAGAVDGLNLFFGALLGANLGTMQGMELFDYFKIILLLAGTVMVLRMLSTSERRLYMIVNVFIYAMIMSTFLLVPRFQPKGVAPTDLHRLAITLAVWLVLVVASELVPTRDQTKSPQD